MGLPHMSTRYRLSVSPHDTARNLAGWFLLNTYLQRKLGVAMRFEPSDNFQDEQDQVLAGGFHLAYAHPFSARRYVHERGFVPVARPMGVYDETLLVSRQGAGLPAQRPLRVASASEQLLVHVLGLTLLDQHAVNPDDCQLQFTGNHVRAVQAVLDGRADVGFVYNETWHGLSASTREALEIVSATTRQVASHCFCVAPELADRLDEVREVLCSMGADPAGRKILDDLRISGFEAMEADALDQLANLVH